MIEQALKRHIRFSSVKGLLTTEQLYDLSVETLDGMAVEAHKELEAAPRVSFISSKKTNDELQLKFDVIKHILDQKLEVRNKKEADKKRAEELHELQVALAEKKREGVKALSVEELEARIAKLA